MIYFNYKEELHMQPKNPFTLTFGVVPNNYIHRAEAEEEIRLKFLESDTGLMYLITGVRGSGKTVFMANIVDHVSQDKEWIVVDLNNNLDLFKSTYAKLSASHKIGIPQVSTKLELSAPGITLSLQEKDMQYSSLETAIEEQLNKAKKKHLKVLLAIDEITSNEETKKFITSFHIFIRHKLPVYLICNGLPGQVFHLQEEPSMTFLYRAPKIELEPLDMNSIYSQYKALLQADKQTAVKLAKYTKGYPFAYQLLGSIVWDNKKEYSDALLEKYDDILAQYVYNKIYSELSEKELQIVTYMCESNETKVSSILNGLHMSSSAFSPYRDRLLKKGIAFSRKRGELDIALPRFAEFLKNRILF